MEAFLISTGVVALAEIGDKTQLLALVLAAKYKKPIPIILGILVATLANHAMAASVGYLAADILSTRWFQIVLAIGFFAMAVWAVIPDKPDNEAATLRGANVFLATAIAFFIVEMGDKTQVATVALAAQFKSILWVAAGTTAGMMLANIPAVYLGERVTRVLPMRYVRLGTAAVFVVIGAWVLRSAF